MSAGEPCSAPIARLRETSRVSLEFSKPSGAEHSLAAELYPAMNGMSLTCETVSGMSVTATKVSATTAKHTPSARRAGLSLLATAPLGPGLAVHCSLSEHY